MVKNYSQRYLLRSQAAFSLMELMLSLAVISMLLVMSTRYFNSVQHQQRLNHAATIVRDIVSASHSWAQSNPDMSNISLQRLIDVNLLTTSYAKNPWGGDVIVNAKANDAFNITITLSQVPEDDCKALQSEFSDYDIRCFQN